MDSAELIRGVGALMTPPRQVTAVHRFRGGPGREAEAARAWAFELTYFFTRGVGEAPRVSYAPDTGGDDGGGEGIYTCTGMIQTTHPGDHDPMDLTGGAPLWLDSALNEQRHAHLIDLYPRRNIWFDGRDHVRQLPACGGDHGRRPV